MATFTPPCFVPVFAKVVKTAAKVTAADHWCATIMGSTTSRGLPAGERVAPMLESMACTLKYVF